MTTDYRPRCDKYMVIWPDKRMGGFEHEDVLMCAIAENRSMGEAQIFKLTCTLPTIYEPIDAKEVKEIAWPTERCPHPIPDSGPAQCKDAHWLGSKQHPVERG